jgi:glucosamine-6-phosphate deaminase
VRVIVVKTKEEMGKVAGSIVAGVMREKAHPVLGLATGSTPIPLYQEMIRLHKEDGLDFSTTISFNLDEYIGLDPSHDQSYRYFMNEQLFDHININKKATHVPDGQADDVEAHSLLYEMMIEDVGGIDVQVLGIGGNGHIGFNEPGSSLASRTRAVDLTPETIQDNSRFFESIEDVPKRAISMGIGTCLEAENILMLATGENKAKAIAAALEGPVSIACPASALQLHPSTTFVVTEDAAKGLKLRYRS